MVIVLLMQEKDAHSHLPSQECVRKARVRACNSVNLKLGGIIEPLLKIVNVLHMCPGLGIAHSDQLAQHGYDGVHSVGTFIASGEVSKKALCA